LANLRKMLRKEAETVSKNKEIGSRNDCTDLMISARFGSDHLHHILPSQQIVDQIVDDLLAYTSEDFNKNLKLGEDSPVVIDQETKAPKEVIFHNRQAIGDILTMTCAVRDFKTQFPNTRVGVHTTAMHIWDNNPYIDHTFRMGSLSANKSTVKIGPGFLTNKSGLWDYHMANAFRMDIQNKMNLKFTQGAIRPDIWLTEEEYNRKPLIDGAYWIFIYGGEPGWPSKQYHRWQEVIDILKDEIKFVQLGVVGHPYPKLNNVIDYIGKTQDRDTGIRDLFNIFLHSQGSLGLVSMHMHLSSVFNNPCVVLAGGREPASFTQYYGHQYIQTNGTLPCVETKACWACKLEGCRNLVDPTNKPTKGHNTKQIPKCIDIIEPEEIAEGIRKYYKGGRLEYGKKIPNTFFKNIVREKKIFTVPKVETVDNELLKKYGFEWGGGSITDKDWLFIQDIFKTYNVKKVLEFGAGLSSLLFATKVDAVVTFETVPAWIKKIQDLADPEKNYIFLWDGKKIEIDTKEFESAFDFAFVDGPAGGQSREFSTKYASEMADLIVVHDAGRVWERKWQEKYLAEEYDMVSKGGHRCHFWAKKEICKMQQKKESAEIQAKIENDDRPSFRMVTTCRGYGGSERSSLFIMKDMLSRGYRVELISTGNISGEYRKNIPSDVIVRPWNDMLQPVDLLTFYTSDTIWNYKKPQYLDVMDKLNCKRKVMILNYQLGGAGEVTWTHNWDLYMFLNSTKEGELLDRLKDAKTKVLPPPTDLDSFFKVDIKYPSANENIKLIRHNSQRDAKHPEYTNELIIQILDEVNDNIEFFYMPPRSTTFDHPNVHKFKVNEIPVPDFLSLGNCFWYHLPPGYQDQGPRVIIEAMACGLPCIGDNNYGARDRITPETGWLCENANDYIEVIKEINSDVTILKEKGQKARERALSEFVPTRWADCIIGEGNES
jgi:ADP-heptose:LPS heptosyltransferase/glycosyltransferase involved in cell wall biosynthesis